MTDLAPSSAIPLMPTKVGNLPLTSGGRTGTMDQPYGGWSNKRKTPLSGTAAEDLTFSASGRVHVEEENTVTVTEGPNTTGSTEPSLSSQQNGGRKNGQYKGGYAWVIWLFVIFIIIALIILAIFWWCKPDWATNTCSDTGKKSLNCYCAGAYAFGIALFLVVILALAWCCCARK